MAAASPFFRARVNKGSGFSGVTIARVSFKYAPIPRMRFAIALLAAALCHSQTFTQRGYFETRTYLYPQTAPGDRGHVIAESMLHYETAWRATPDLRIAGAIDAQTDTHRERNARCIFPGSIARSSAPPSPSGA